MARQVTFVVISLLLCHCTSTDQADTTSITAQSSLRVSSLNPGNQSLRSSAAAEILSDFTARRITSANTKPSQEPNPPTDSELTSSSLAQPHPASTNDDIGRPKSSSLPKDIKSKPTETLHPSSASSRDLQLISLLTSSTTINGADRPIPVLKGGPAEITLPPTTTTLSNQKAAKTASKLSNRVQTLIAAIPIWKKNPGALKDQILSKIEPVTKDVESLIPEPDHSSSAVECQKVRNKRSLLGFIGRLTNSLTCMSEHLNELERKIKVGDVSDVDSTLSDLSTENMNLSDNQEESGSRSMPTQTRTSPSSRQSKSAKASVSHQSSSLTATSCTKKITAPRVTVRCTPTMSTVGISLISSEICSTLTDSTSGCDVVQRITTTTLPVPSAYETPCALSLCDSLCSSTRGPLSGNSGLRSLPSGKCTKMSGPPPAAMTGSFSKSLHSRAFNKETPTLRVDIGKRNEAIDIGLNATYSPRTTPAHTSQDDSIGPRMLAGVSPPFQDYIRSLGGINWILQDGGVAGHFFDFNSEQRLKVGVKGLYGCTSLVIVTLKGVFVSHIWEVPMFINPNGTPTSDSFFSTVFTELRDGTARCPSLRTLVGDNNSPGPLHARYKPRIFLFTPWTTPYEFFNRGITTPKRFQHRVEQLLTQGSQLVPGVQHDLVPYFRRGSILSNQEPGFAGRFIVEYDPEQAWQPRPGDELSDKGLQIGAYRLWADGRFLGFYQFALPANSFPPGVVQGQIPINYMECPGNVISSSVIHTTDGMSTLSTSRLRHSEEVKPSNAIGISLSKVSAMGDRRTSTTHIRSNPLPTFSDLISCSVTTL